MKILGIETSCDETGIAIYDTDKGLLSDQLYSQIELHARYGGVVPELASRDHIKRIPMLTEQAINKADLNWKDIDAIAYTAGPGLVGSLMVGASFAKGLGFALSIPTLGVHHLEAHLLAVMLEDEVPSFPFIALLVSGGHTALVYVQALGSYEILGETLDDAVGEAFDKTAKLLGLPYPGGYALSQLAKKGKPRFHFPRPMLDKAGLDFSYSGLKTHVVNLLKKQAILDEEFAADVAFAFQEAAVESLVIKAMRALEHSHCKKLVVAGGVGANQRLRDHLDESIRAIGGQVFYPRPHFCTDNGAMVAYLGSQRLIMGERDLSLAVTVKPKWDLESLAPPGSVT
jgi:N6-L-threonylcarbamoyladenine synthase